MEKTFGGRGVLLSGVPGTERGKVAVLGAGVVGLNACRIAYGMGAEVTVLDVNTRRLAHIDDLYAGQVTTLYSNERNIEKIVRESDLVIGAVFIPGAKTPKLVRREHLGTMKKGAVIVDVAVDQGGCFETTTKPIYHDDPVFVFDNVVHYCVANMPSVVSRTSTTALTNATLVDGLLIADLGVELTCRQSPSLLKGLNTYAGRCTCPGVSEALGIPYWKADDILD